MVARDRSGIEAAAVNWLTEINRINAGLRAAQNRLWRERDTADSLLAERDKLIATAEAARAMADAAREACLAAQSGVLPLEAETTPEAALDAGPAPAPAPSTPVYAAEPLPTAPAASDGTSAPPAPSAPAIPQIRAAEMAAPPSDERPVAPEPPPDGLFVDLRARPPQLILRLLNRELWTLNRLVDQLAAGSVDSRSAWQLRLSDFVDATIAAAIDEACFEFPGGHPFWDLFTREQSREVALGLAALGYRYDGFGEFLDGRVPDQRDLALAIGSAGLLPMRIRYWPRSGEYGELYRNVRVAADVFLATRAPSLTLGELLVVLDRRAEQLADLWNDWDRVRPLLLSNPLN